MQLVCNCQRKYHFTPNFFHKIGLSTHKLQDTLMRPWPILKYLDDVIKGLLEVPTNKVDNFITDGLTQHMFETDASAHDQLDLVASM